MAGKHAPAIERFLRLRATDPVTGCWNWLGSRTNQGYGLFYDGTKVVAATRFIWREFCGEDLTGFDLHHMCRNPSCVNVTHLWPLTRAEHVRLHPRRKPRKGAHRDPRRAEVQSRRATEGLAVLPLLGSQARALGQAHPPAEGSRDPQAQAAGQAEAEAEGERSGAHVGLTGKSGPPPFKRRQRGGLRGWSVTLTR